jgi:uncharacterized protein (TIGR00255 family)
MLKSMTAYGRGSYSSSVGHFIIEIQSLNRKFLDINTVTPKELLRYEIEIKKWIAQQVARGQVNVKVSVDYEEASPLIVKPNIPLARQLRAAWDKIAKEIGFAETSVDLSLFADVKELFSVEEEIEDEKPYREAIKEALDRALKAFVKMKTDEGTVLQMDIAMRMGRLRSSMEEIAQRGSGATGKYREKLKARLEEILPGCMENEERLLREVAILAEKVDITEEVTRFLCHLKHFDEVIQSSEAGVAKTLEFILQELGREINTIGSKSSDMDIARRVVDIKSVLEQVKEQIQNVE